jgi:cell division septation protein DedD
MYRLQYRNFGSYQTLVVNHTVDVNNTDRAGVRWYELRSSGGDWSIYQQGTYSPDNSNRWMGSIAMNGNGDIGLGYSLSSSTIYPSIRYTGRLAGDPLGQMTRAESTLIAGAGSQTSTKYRWGDYSMMAVDPLDDCTFWYTQEYYQTTSGAGWQTRIGAFQLAECSPIATPTSTATPSSTPTSTATETSTSTPTATPTPTSTDTATPTPSPTATSTPDFRWWQYLPVVLRSS